MDVSLDGLFLEFVTNLLNIYMYLVLSTVTMDTLFKL